MSTILKSLHGLQLGLDKDGYLTSPVGIKVPEVYVGTSGSEVAHSLTVTAASSGTVIANSGVATLGATAGNNPTYHLAAPVAGSRKTISASTGSTGQIVSSTGAGATYRSTAGSTQTAATFPAGASLSLLGVSTSLWQVTNNYGTVTLA